MTIQYISATPKVKSALFERIFGNMIQTGQGKGAKDKELNVFLHLNVIVTPLH